MMGGRVAEEIKFGKENITSGASSDIDQATKLARAMVTRWGFSDKLGQVAYGENQEEVFLGHSVAQPAERVGGDRADHRRRGAPADRRGLHRRPAAS